MALKWIMAVAKAAPLSIPVLAVLFTIASAQQTVGQGPRDHTINDPWFVTTVTPGGLPIGIIYPGVGTVPIQTQQAPTIPFTSSLLQSLGVYGNFEISVLSDGQKFISITAPNVPAAQSQTGLVVRNPDAGTISDPTYAGSGTATENSLLKGIYQAAASPIPAGANTIGAVNQAGTWIFTCASGCGGAGGGSTAEIVNSAGQQLGSNLPGVNNIPFLTTQAQTSLSPFSLLPSTGLWDGRNYASFAPPNTPPTAAQSALVVTLSPNSPSSGTGANVNVSQFGGTNVVTGTGASGSGIPRVTVSSDSNVLATQSGTWTVQQGTPPWADNITQVAGNAVATSASGQLKVGITGNAGANLDAAGQNAASPANELLVGGQFNTAPTTITSGNISPLQMDSSGNLLVNVKAGGGSGGTSSSFGVAFPSTGTAIGVKNGTNMVNLNADGSGNLDVNCVAGCSSSSFADQSAFTFGTTPINTIGGVYSATPNALASGTAGAALLTSGRILQNNTRNSAGQELGANLAGQANIPLGVNQVPTTLNSSPLLAASGIWDGKNYASFTPSFGSAIAAQAALVMAISPNTPLPAGTNTIGAVTQSGGPWSVGGTVTANAGTGTFNVGGTVTAAQATAANLNATVVGTGTFAVQAAQSGTWTVQQGGAPWADNVTQFGGTNVSTGTGASGAGIPRVTVSNDSNILATQSGTWTVAQGGAPWSQNITQIAGNAVSTAATGVMKVGITGNAGAAMDAAGQNAASPANELLTGCQFNTAPTTITSGNISPVQCNSTGSINVNIAASGATVTVGGTVTANQGGAPWTVNPGTAANWAIGATGAAVPANAVLEGMSQGGNTTALTGTSGNLNVNLAGNSFGTLTVAGTVTANQGGAPWSQNVTQFGGTNISTGTGASGTGIPRVTVSNDSNILATQSGTWTVQQGTPPWTIQGDSASGAANAGNPAKVGGVFNTTQPTVTTGQTVDAQATARGALIVATGVDNLTVQQGGAPWSVSQSGTWTVQPGNTPNTTPWLFSISQGGNTAAVNASSQLSVNCANCSGSGVSQQDATGFTFGTTNMVPIGGVYSATPAALPNGDAGVALLTQGRILQTNNRNSAGQELGENLAGQANIPLQVNIASQVQNNTLLKSTDNYGQLRTASWVTDGTNYSALTAPGKPPRAADSAIVVTPSPIPSLQCPLQAAISQTASTTVVTNPGGKYIHVCSYKIISSAAQNVGLIEGTGAACATNSTNLDGQGTAGSIALAANGGFQTGTGAGQIVIPMQKLGDNLCVVQSAASNISGYVNYGLFN